MNPHEQRYRYPFTNCTHCGPRLSIVKGVPYDRANTNMAAFPMCEHCASEYRDPADRRFHAQPIACPVCGPQVWLERLDGQSVAKPEDDQWDDIDVAIELLRKGEILAIRGLGGFHLACDATNEETVKRLRNRKRRFGKPFALMAGDLEVIRRYCSVTDVEQKLLESPEAPIVLLKADGSEQLPETVAPGFNCLGFMLPYTPLHLLIVKHLDRPLVMTSGNLSEEPQIIGNQEARTKLKGIADTVMFHNRDIANRIDDSVVRER